MVHYRTPGKPGNALPDLEGNRQLEKIAKWVWWRVPLSKSYGFFQAHKRKTGPHLSVGNEVRKLEGPIQNYLNFLFFSLDNRYPSSNI
jgi:hypothetical protein